MFISLNQYLVMICNYIVLWYNFYIILETKCTLLIISFYVHMFMYDICNKILCYWYMLYHLISYSLFVRKIKLIFSDFFCNNIVLGTELLKLFPFVFLMMFLNSWWVTFPSPFASKPAQGRMFFFNTKEMKPDSNKW